MADSKVGKISHYYDKILVAVVELTAELKVGDRIKISGHDHEFEQTVSSIQMEHQSVEEAQSGQSVGVKVDQPVKPGDDVYKI